MARAQLSFAAGEVTPSLFARSDIQRYYIGLRTCRNMLIARQGGAYNRPGTAFVANAKFSNRKARLIEFIFSETDSYMMEFGHQYIRWFRNNAPLQVSGVAAWNSATAYSIGSLVVHSGITYYATVASTNQTPPNLSFWYPLTGNVLEIPTPYQESELPRIQFVQSGDIVTLVHPSHPVKELVRFGNTNWVLRNMVFGPKIGTPQNVTRSPQGFGNLFGVSWTVVAVGPDGEFSNAGGVANQLSPTSSDPITISWTAVSGAVSYRVYRNNLGGDNVVSGLIGEVTGLSFKDSAQDPIEDGSLLQTEVNPFQVAGEYPSTVFYSQQRLFFGGPDNGPDRIRGSRVGSFGNFNVKIPVTDDDPVDFTLVGNQVQLVRFLRESRQLVALTSSGEWEIRGGNDGIIRPDAINAKNQSQVGVSFLPPVQVGTNLLMNQARGSKIRNLIYGNEGDVYDGQDLTIWAAHLFDGFTMADWTYQQNPHSIVWIARNDGKLIGLTYLKEQEMVAWHRHDTDGEFESVGTIPFEEQDQVWCIVKRGNARLIERVLPRKTDIPNMIFMDSSVSFSVLGNTNASIRILRTGVFPGLADEDPPGEPWGPNVQRSIELFAGAPSHPVGTKLSFLAPDGSIITGTVGVTNGSGTFQKIVFDADIPLSMRNTNPPIPSSDWGVNTNTFTGLAHLNGKEVSVLADGKVLHSPLNPDLAKLTVTGGTVTLDQSYGSVHIGLPYVSDLETLDIEGEFLIDRKKLVTKVTAYVENSRGFFAGPKSPGADNLLTGLIETKVRLDEDYESPISLRTEPFEINIESRWSKGGRVFIRNPDPIPLGILSIIPSGFIPGGR